MSSKPTSPTASISEFRALSAMYSPRLTFSETLKAIEARLGPYPTDTVIRRLKYSLPIRPRIPASNRSDHITHDEDVTGPASVNARRLSRVVESEEQLLALFPSSQNAKQLSTESASSFSSEDSDDPESLVVTSHKKRRRTWEPDSDSDADEEYVQANAELSAAWAAEIAERGPRRQLIGSSYPGACVSH